MIIESFNKTYISAFEAALQSIEVTDASGNAVTYNQAVHNLVELLLKVQALENKVMMIGNGGSAGICSHMAVDYWKNGGIRATAFNDSSLLTCISNDYSYAEVFSKPIEMFAQRGDLVFCISSSGKSVNILNGAGMANEKECTTVTFSGFGKDNPLRSKGHINFFVNSYSYGFVELLHNFIIHNVLDAKLFVHDKIDVFNSNKKM